MDYIQWDSSNIFIDAPINVLARTLIRDRSTDTRIIKVCSIFANKSTARLSSSKKMNSTLHVYQSISSAPPNEVVQISMSVLMSLGLISHIYIIFVLFKSAIPSTVTQLLLHLQCVSQGLFSILVIVQINTRNFTPISNTVPINPIVCYLFQSGALSTILRLILYCSILCQSADRLRGLVHPNTYHVHAKYFMLSSVFSIVVYSVLASIPRISKVFYLKGSCNIKASSINPYVLSALECLLRYGIPILIFVPTNVILIRKLYQLQLLTSGNLRAGRSVQVNGNSEATGVRKSPDSLTSLQISLFINTLCITIQMTLIECTFVILAILNLRGIIRYDASSPVRAHFLCAIVLLDSLNPTLSILTIKALRTTASNHSKLIYRLYQKCSRIRNPS